MYIPRYIFSVIHSYHHLPSGLPISTLFPSLAMLLHLIEPMTTPTQSGVGVALVEGQRRTTVMSNQKKQLCEVLATFREAYRSVYSLWTKNNWLLKGGPYWGKCSFILLCRYAEESLKAVPSNALELKRDHDIFLFKAFEESLLPAVLVNFVTKLLLMGVVSYIPPLCADI